MPLYRECLLSLESLLRKIPHTQFDFSMFISRHGACGTICCALGWMPKVDPSNWEWTLETDDSTSLRFQGTPFLPYHFYGDVGAEAMHAVRYFGLTIPEFRRIFVSPETYERCNPNKNEVADRILAYVQGDSLVGTQGTWE
jgi:hypothetical protein